MLLIFPMSIVISIPKVLNCTPKHPFFRQIQNFTVPPNCTPKCTSNPILTIFLTKIGVFLNILDALPVYRAQMFK